MTASTPDARPTRGRIFLRSLLIALAAAVISVVITLFTGGFDPLWTPIGAVGVAVVLTLVFFSLNGGWRAPAKDAAGEHR